MLDLKFIRENEQVVREAIANKGEEVDLARLFALDSERRSLLSRVDKLKHERNEVSHEIAELKRTGWDAGDKIERMKGVSDQIKSLDNTIRSVEESLNEVQLTIPNIPHSTVPVGRDQEDNVVVREW